MVASNDRTHELRAHKLTTLILSFIDGGKRDPKEVASVLQVIHDHPRDFLQRLGLTDSGLEFVREIQVHEECFHPKEDFQTCEWLWISDEMGRLVRSAKCIDSVPASTLRLSRLKQAMDDEEIINKAGEKQHVFTDMSIFLAWLHQILRRQKDGPESAEQLLPTDRWTVFHVDTDGGRFAVDVRWSSVDRRWYVDCYRLYDYQWGGGTCAVSSNC